MKLLARLVVCVAFLLSAGSATSEAEIPVETFSRLPRVAGVKISPDGNHLASVLTDEGISFVVVRTIGEPDLKFLVRCDNVERRIGWFRWANDDWLLISVAFAYKRDGVPTTETRLVRINRKDGDPIALFKPTIASQHWSQFQDGMISVLPDDPKHILLALDDERANYPSVYKVNVETGLRRKVLGSRRPIRSWMVDQQGRVRLGVGYDEGVISIHVRATEGRKWRKLWSYEAIIEAGIEVMGFDADPNVLYTRELHEGRNAVFSVDLNDPALPRKLVAYDPAYDIEGRLIYSPKTRAAVGVFDRGADGSRIYWDDSYAELQRSVDAALPDTTNLLTAFSRDEQRYVAYAFSDLNPGMYYYGNRDKGQLSEFGTVYPELSDHELSGKEPISYEARDGLTIEGYLTRPWGERPEPWPAIVLPHGGPASRDYGQFDFISEFLASRGYVVLQMNFRGSSGYGWDFLESGFRDLGGKMQDDITDGAKWLVEEGYAEASRICIMGGSYGGYAALWGAVKTPDLFQCAVSVNGVSDWAMVLSESRYYVTGDSAADQLGKRSALKQVSPLRRVEEIRIPVLLVHGEDDRVVPVRHSRKMAKALEKHGKAYRYVELPKGVHALENQGNRTEFLRAAESFLAQHLPRFARERGGSEE